MDKGRILGSDKNSPFHLVLNPAADAFRLGT